MSGKHVAKTNKHAGKRKSPLALLVLVMVMVGLVAGGTLAYLLTSTNAITNTFTPASTTPDIVEEFDGTEKSSIIIQNSGTAAAYIRVALVGNTVDASGHVTGGFDVSVTTLGANWVKASDGYYYYTLPVAGGYSTGELLGSKIVLAEGQTVTVLAQSIQAEPAAAVQEAWGVTISSGSVTAYTGS